MPYETGYKQGLDYNSLLATSFGGGEALTHGISCTAHFGKVNGMPTTAVALENTFQLNM